MKTVKSYKGTKVHWGKSQANICRLLSSYGIQDIRFTMLSSTNELVVEFNYPKKYGDKDVLIGVRMIMPVRIGRNEKESEQYKNQLHRMLFYRLKVKFEWIQFNAVEFEKEFFSDLVILDKQGQSSTLYQLVAPQYKKGIEKSEQGEILMLPSKDE